MSPAYITTTKKDKKNVFHATESFCHEEGYWTQNPCDNCKRKQLIASTYTYSHRVFTIYQSLENSSQ